VNEVGASHDPFHVLASGASFPVGAIPDTLLESPPHDGIADCVQKYAFLLNTELPICSAESGCDESILFSYEFQTKKPTEYAHEVRMSYGGRMNTRTYPTDWSNAEWLLLARFFPTATTGRPRQHADRTIVNAIFSVVRTGGQWRLLPREFPKWQTVDHYYRFGRLNGTWPRIHTA